MNWLLSLKLLPIIMSACFAVLALLTRLKDNAGRLTTHGKIALAGIAGAAALSSAFYALDVQAALESAQKAQADANAAEQRLLTPLGPMRLRIRIGVPAGQFPFFRDRIRSEYMRWGQPYPMPITSRIGPFASPNEARARNFFGLIIASVSTEYVGDRPRQNPPSFEKFMFIRAGQPALDQDSFRSALFVQGESRAPASLFYDGGSDAFILESETPYFDEFDASGHVLSFRDFAGKSVRVALNVREAIRYEVKFLEIQSRNGKGRILVDGFTNEPFGSNEFAGLITQNSLLD